MNPQMCDKVPYDIFDNSGMRYRIWVEKNTVPLLDLDHKLRYRTLQDAKRRGFKPDGQWASFNSTALSVEGNFHPNASFDVSIISPIRKRSKFDDVSAEPDEEIESSLNESFTDSLHLLDGDAVHPSSSQGTDGPESMKASSSQSCGTVRVALFKDSSPSSANNHKENVDPSIWTDFEVHTLLNEYGKRIDRFQNQRVHTLLWEEISRSLMQAGCNFDGASCQKKKRNLDTYFIRQRKQGKTQWPFYRAMEHIKNKKWPPNFVSGAQHNSEIEDEDEVNDQHNTDGHSNDVIGNEAQVVLFDEAVGGEQAEKSLEQGNSSGASLNPCEASDMGIENLPVSPSAQVALSNEAALSDPEELDLAPFDYVEKNNNILSTSKSASTSYIPPSQLTLPSQAAQDKAPPLTDWTPDAEQALVEEYYEAKQQLVAHPVRNSSLFGEIHKAMADRGYGFDCNTCRRKFYDLLGEFRRKYDVLKLTGAGGCDWPLYDIFIKYEGENSVTLKPVKSVSAGAVAKMTLAREKLDTVRSGKARPPNDSRRKVERMTAPSSGSRGIGFQNRKLDYLHEKLEVEKQFVSEFSGLRQDMRSREQVAMQQLQLLREIKEAQLRRLNN